MLLPIETWSAACRWPSACTSRSIVWPSFGEALLDPGERERQRRALPLQAPRELRDERT